MSSRIPAFFYFYLNYLLPEQRCTLYTGSGVMYTHGMASFFLVMKKFHCIQINQDLSSCLVNFKTSRMPESCPFKEYGGGMCPLGRLDQSPISSKVPLSIMIGVDGRARTGIIA